jgi:hypothetical protein
MMAVQWPKASHLGIDLAPPIFAIPAQDKPRSSGGLAGARTKGSPPCPLPDGASQGRLDTQDSQTDERNAKRRTALGVKL